MRRLWSILSPGIIFICISSFHALSSAREETVTSRKPARRVAWTARYGWLLSGLWSMMISSLRTK
ncbi:hypothetical protein POJ06DRAFT_254445 [Lipomyces tetrasporus]|uniref:Uncharacterized protein n=1 Tax=Lipomyces tetrasporus TaxID=54092 RepID=A0AAD7QR55_9ASCO|nr:uncharacterized protein POJ06DRAFT_254445 [Lipomyces tetrasporus]KAJ8099765.1 hypothetical protein POJ06DRAFT_254445 [Lipomyces tetrasporus]